MNVHNVVIEIINVYYSVYCTLIYKYKFQLAIRKCSTIQYEKKDFKQNWSTLFNV